MSCLSKPDRSELFPPKKHIKPRQKGFAFSRQLERANLAEQKYVGEASGRRVDIISTFLRTVINRYGSDSVVIISSFTILGNLCDRVRVVAPSIDLLLSRAISRKVASTLKADNPVVCNLWNDKVPQHGNEQSSSAPNPKGDRLKSKYKVTGDSPPTAPEGGATDEPPLDPPAGCSGTRRTHYDYTCSGTQTTADEGDNLVLRWIKGVFGMAKDMFNKMVETAAGLWEWIVCALKSMFQMSYGCATNTVPSVFSSIIDNIKKVISWGSCLALSSLSVFWNYLGVIIALIFGVVIGFFSATVVGEFIEGVVFKLLGRYIDLSQYTNNHQLGTYIRSRVTGDSPVIGDSPNTEPVSSLVVMVASFMAVGFYGGITPDGKTFMSYVKNVVSMSHLVKGMYSALIGVIMMLPEAIKYRALEVTSPELHAEYLIKDWNARSSALMIMSKTPDLLTSPAFSKAIDEQLADGVALLKNSRTRSQVGVQYAQLIKIASMLYNYRQSTKRSKPFSFHIYGEPGIGKSLITPTIIKDVFEYDEALGEIYHRPVSTAYWNGYINQKCVVYDEFMALRGKNAIIPESEYLELISVGDFQPPMASLEDPSVGLKGTRAKPDVVMTIANEPYWNDVEVNKKAFHRRRDVVIKMSLSSVGEKYRKNDNLDLKQLRRDEPDVFPSVGWASFQTTDTNGGNPSKKMSYAALIDCLRDMYGEHQMLADALAVNKPPASETVFAREYKAQTEWLLRGLKPIHEEPVIGAAMSESPSKATGDSPVTVEEMDEIKIDDDAKTITSSDDTIINISPEEEEAKDPVMCDNYTSTNETRATIKNRVTGTFRSIASFIQDHLSWAAMIGVFVAMLCMINLLWKWSIRAEGDAPSGEPSGRMFGYRSRAYEYKVSQPTSFNNNKATGDSSASVVLRGIVQISWDGKTWQSALGTHDRFIITNWHFFLRDIDGEGIMRKDGDRFFMKRGETTHVLTFDTSTLVVWKNNDLAMYYINDMSVQAFKDIRKKFVSEGQVTLSKPFYGRMIRKTSDVSVYATFNPGCSYGANGMEFEVDVFKYAGVYHSGDCGSPIICTSGENTGKILGIHVASHKTSPQFGYATPIVQQHLYCQDFIDNCVVGDSCEFKYEGANVAYDNVSANPGGDQKSKITKSVLYHSLAKRGFPESYAPAILSRADDRWKQHPYSSIYPGPLERNVQRTAAVDLPDVNMDLTKVVEDMVECYTLGEIVEPMTIEEAVFGIDGYMDAIDPNASPGWPLNKICGKEGRRALIDFENKVIDPAFRSEIVDKWESVKQGHQGKYKYRAVLKDEILPKEKIEECKTRVIYACPLDLQILTRLAMGHVLVRMAKNGCEYKNALAIGINQGSYDLDGIKKYLDEVHPSGYIAGDGKEFDRRVHPKVQDAAYEVLMLVCAEAGCNMNAIKEVCRAARKSPVLAGQREVEFNCSHLSGIVLTTIMNCFAHEVMWRWAFSKILPDEAYSKRVRAKFLGDDNIVAVDPAVVGAFNAVTYAAKVATIGSIYTSDVKGEPLTEKPKPFTDITFLGVHPVKCDGAWMGAFKKEIFLKTLMFTKNNNETIQAEAEMWCEQSAAWGKEFFTWYTAQVNKALQENDLQVIYPGAWKDVKRALANRTATNHVPVKVTGDSPPDHGLTTYSLTKLQPEVGSKAVIKPSTSVKADPVDIQFGLESDVHRATFTWNSSSPMIMRRYTIPGELIEKGDDNLQDMPFSRYAMFRGTMYVTFQVNGTPFQAGMVVAAYRPLKTGEIKKWDILTLDHVILTPYNSSNAVLRIPFRFDRQYMSTKAMEASSIYADCYGQLLMYALSPLSEGEVSISIFTRFESADFRLPRPDGDLRIARRSGSLASGYKWAVERQDTVRGDGNTNTTYQVEKVLGNFDSRVQGNTTSPNVSVGLDNPPIASGGVAVGPQLPSLSKSVGSYNTLGLELNPGMLRPADGIYGVDYNEMDVEWLLSRKILYKKVKWYTSNAPGTALANGVLSPVVYQDPFNIDVAAGMSRAIVDMFTFWRMDIRLTIMVVKTPFHSGRLRLPISYMSDTAPQWAKTSAMYAPVLDFTRDNDVNSIVIPYNATTEFLRTYSGPNVLNALAEDHMGRWTLFVMNELVCPSSVKNNVDVMIFMSFENPVVAVPRSWGLCQFTDPGRKIETGFTARQFNRSNSVTGDAPVVQVDPLETTQLGDSGVAITADAPETAVVEGSDGKKWDKYTVRNIVEILRRFTDITRYVLTSVNKMSNGSSLKMFRNLVVFKNKPYWDVGECYAGWHGSLKYRVRLADEFRVFYFPWGDIAEDDMMAAVMGLMNTVDNVTTTFAGENATQSNPPGRVPTEMSFNMSGDDAYADFTIPYQHQNTFLRTYEGMNNACTGIVVIATPNNPTSARLQVLQGAGDDFSFGAYTAPPMSMCWRLGITSTHLPSVFGRRIGETGTGFKLKN